MRRTIELFFICFILFSCHRKDTKEDPNSTEKINLKPYYFPLDKVDTLIFKSHFKVEGNSRVTNDILYNYIQRLNQNIFCFATYEEDFRMHDSLIMEYDSIGITVNDWYFMNELNTLIKAKVIKNRMFTWEKSRQDEDIIELDYTSILYGELTQIHYTSIAKFKNFENIKNNFSNEQECAIINTERIIEYTNIKTDEKFVRKIDITVMDLKGFGYLMSTGTDNFGNSINDNVNRIISPKEWRELKIQYRNEEI